MEHLPKRTSLVSETVAALKEWIGTGVLRDVLPGELPLKQRLGVGRDTLRRGLKLLEQDGWVTPAAQGQQRRVRPEIIEKTRWKSDATPLPVTFLSPHKIEGMVTLLEMEDTRVLLAEQNRSLRYISPKIFQFKHPAKRLEHLVLENPSAAWVLYIVGERVQRWFGEQHIPALIYGTPFPGVDLPYVSSDWGAAAYHAAVQLLRHGHRVIGIMEYHEKFPGVLAEELGIKRALSSVGDEGQLVVFRDDRTPASIARSLEQAFSLQKRPTAFVLTYSSQLLTCYSWLLARGIRVPADVSIISLPNDSWFSELYPPVCYYEPALKTMSRNIGQRVLELVANGQTISKSISIPLHYVSGKTIGPVSR